jgi:hypothetical protein
MLEHNLLTLEEALNNTSNKKRHLLLGNGFSIALFPHIFAYKKLFEKADFSKTPELKDVFDLLKTQDFEIVIKALNSTASVGAIYEVAKQKLMKIKRHASELHEILVDAIAGTHPDLPGSIDKEKFMACKKFLLNFRNNDSKIYTMNYDLLLYWVCMQKEIEPAINFDDGFRSTGGMEENYVVWDDTHSHSQDIIYLHGALHLFDAGYELQKYTWINTGIRLIDQIKTQLEQDNFPLIVAGGTWQDKMKKIEHSAYLSRGYRSFANIQGTLFIFGHSLADNDDHILRLIENGKLEQVYIGIYGNIDKNQTIINRGEQLKDNRTRKGNSSKKLEVKFFDTVSVNVWG